MVDLRTRLLIALGAVIALGLLGALFFWQGEKEAGSACLGALGLAAIQLGDMLRAKNAREQKPWYRAQKERKAPVSLKPEDIKSEDETTPKP